MIALERMAEIKNNNTDDNSPLAKQPTWDRDSGRNNKSTMSTSSTTIQATLPA
jgi:hypothetical protein